MTWPHGEHKPAARRQARLPYHDGVRTGEWQYVICLACLEVELWRDGDVIAACEAFPRVLTKLCKKILKTNAHE